MAVINSTMSGRAPRETWAPVLAGGNMEHRVGSALEALDPTWDFVTMEPTDWVERNVATQLAGAFDSLAGKGRRLSISSKLLHLKRPALVPILDRLVREQLGDPGAGAAGMIDQLRIVARANKSELEAIKAWIPDVHVSLVRILDAILWSTHPGNKLMIDPARWEYVLRPR